MAPKTKGACFVQSALPMLQDGDRFELCSNLIQGGGLTPSVGLVQCVKSKIKSSFKDVKLMVMIRPRSGSFVYSPYELQTMVADITTLSEHGADGFVFGCLTEHGHVDLPALRSLANVVDKKPITFHRAFDVVDDWQNALIDIRTVPQITRILTSGQAFTALLGQDRLKEIQSIISPRPIDIIIASGISAESLIELLPRLPDTTDIHLSSSIKRPYVRAQKDQDGGVGEAVIRGVERGFGDGEWMFEIQRLQNVRKVLSQWERGEELWNDYETVK